MVVKKSKPRKARSYKIADADYFKAMKVAKSRGHQLATLVEQFVINLSKNQ